MNNTTRRIIALLLSIITLFAICACSKSQANPAQSEPAAAKTEEPEVNDPTVKMSVNAFKAKAEAFGLEFPILQPVKPFGVSEIAVGCIFNNSDVDWQAEYYILYNEETAENSFTNMIPNMPSGGEVQDLPDGGRLYEQTADGQYGYMYCYGKSMLFILTDEKFENDAKAFVASLGL